MATANNVAVTEEAKLHIGQYFLLASPPGQFQDVLSGKWKKILLKNVYIINSPS
jgi:hypothetical protein